MTALTLPEALVPLVTDWFAACGRRSLPWRQSPDPYRVWLSEIMLQQTRIEAVIPYYLRFLAVCPDPAALASLDDDRLMKLWEGLGYYSRARNLKKAAGILVREYGGALPPDYALLRSLPGIGAYTAGAVASIAFGLPEPAVDGNVLRVVSRIAALEDDVTLPGTKAAVTEALRAVYPAGERAALLTEGLMELGEEVCVPNGEPRCASCPVRALCEARQRGEADRFPVRSPKKERRIEERTVLLLRSADGRVLLCRRGPEGLLAGMWEFPNFPGTLSPEEAEATARALLSDKKTGRAVPLGTAKHLFTHVEWRMAGYEIAAEALPSDVPFAAVTPGELREEYAVPSAFRAWVKKV